MVYIHAALGAMTLYIRAVTREVTTLEFDTESW